MSWLKGKKTVAVHDGNFHPDDVFSVALLSILHDGNIKVIRTRDEKEISKADIVADTGSVYDPDKDRFDHHQEGGAGFRDNKIAYSAFGLLWKKYGEKVCGSKKVADIIDRRLVEVIDADDCGVELCRPAIGGVFPFMFTDIIYSLRPTWNERGLDIDEMFFNAVDFTKAVLSREIKVAKDRVEALSLVEEVYLNSQDKRIIVFNEGYLPKNLLNNYPEPLLAVYKEKAGVNWRVTTIEISDESYQSRKNFPETWWGKKDEELAKVTGVADAVFCRNGGIYAGAKTREGAIKLAQKALENNK